jgi:hypothetical protein
MSRAKYLVPAFAFAVFLPFLLRACWLGVTQNGPQTPDEVTARVEELGLHWQQDGEAIIVSRKPMTPTEAKNLPPGFVGAVKVRPLGDTENLYPPGRAWGQWLIFGDEELVALLAD